MNGFENRVGRYVLGLIVRCWLVVPLQVYCCDFPGPGLVALKAMFGGPGSGWVR